MTDTKDKSTSSTFPENPPSYTTLAFWHYSQRLQDYLKNTLIKEIKKQLISFGKVEAAWIALSVSTSPGKTGFALGAKYFDDTDTTFKVTIPKGLSIRNTVVPLNSLKTAVLSNSKKNGKKSVKNYSEYIEMLNKLNKKDIISSIYFNLPEIFDISFISSYYEEKDIPYGKREDISFDSLLVEYPEKNWCTDIERTLSTNQRAECEMSPEAVYDRNNFIVKTCPKDVHPRDMASKNCIVIVPSTKQALPQKLLDKTQLKDPSVEIVTFAAAWEYNKENTGQLYHTPPFIEDIDIPARVVLDCLSKKHENSGKIPILVMLPINKDNGASNAMLAVVVMVNSGFFNILFRIIENAEKAKRVNAFNNSLSDIIDNTAKAPELIEALDMLTEAFRCREQSIYRVISEFERSQLDPSEINLPQYIIDDTGIKPIIDKEIIYLTKLWNYTGAASKSPTKYPLDAICQDILGTMKYLASSVNWEKLVLPLVHFAQQEQLLLGAREQRDHYIHTLKVYLLGRKFLIDNEVYDEFTIPRWILASLFHDVCYPIQNAEDWLKSYLENLIPRGVNGDISTNGILGGWDQKGYENCWFDILLRLVDKRLSKWLTKSKSNKSETHRFQSNVMYNLLRKRNHAVLAAASLLERGDSIIKEKYDSKKTPSLNELTDINKCKAEDLKLCSELFDAATAIILHDPKVWEALPKSGFKLNGSKTTSDDKNAWIVWALAFADVVQE